MISMKDVEEKRLTSVEQEELNIKINAFRAALTRNGRPGFIVCTFEMTLAHLLRSDEVMRLAPWIREDNEMQVFEVQGSYGAGWWAEGTPGILMNVDFDGYGGLNAFDVACVIAEQPNPSQELVKWVESIIQDIPEAAMNDAIQCIPVDIRQYVGLRFANGSRRLILGEAGSEDHPLFYLHEEIVCRYN